MALFIAANEVFDWLGKHDLRACIIGGLAVQRLGEPRLTQDVDITLLAEFGDEEGILDLCLGSFAARRLAGTLRDRQPEAAKLDAAIAANLLALQSGSEGGDVLWPPSPPP